jgi:hypothetical protein
MFRKYVFNVLIGIDQLANAILGGDPDMTISGRLGRILYRCRFCRWICLILSWIDPRDGNHCEKVIEEDEDGEREVWKW